MSEPGSAVRGLTLLQCLAEVLPTDRALTLYEIQAAVEARGLTVDVSALRQRLDYLVAAGLAKGGPGWPNPDCLLRWQQAPPERWEFPREGKS